MRLLGGHDRAHDLDEREHRHRVEEVHAEHAVGLRGVGGQLHDRHRRGVGGEEVGVGQDLVELEEQLALGLLVLDHGLDGGVGALEVLDAGGVGEALAGGGAVVLGEPAGARGAVERLVDLRARLLGAGVVDLDDGDVDARAGADLSDARAHEAATDNPDAHGPGR